MAQKTIDVAGIGNVIFQKRANSRSVRIHIQGDSVKVTMPRFMTYGVASAFVRTRRSWISQNLKQRQYITHGSPVGKSHSVTLHKTTSKQLSTRVTPNEVRVFMPADMSVEDDKVQSSITKASEKALHTQTTGLLVPRLKDLAFEYDFDVNEVKVKKLKRRWGSCDSRKNITLNSYLAQLSWRQIDYVLVHELAHTQHLNHSTLFWKTVEQVLPDYKARRSELKKQQPLVQVG